MPTYDYVCTACEHEWQAVQKMTDDRIKDCPRCEASTAKRLISSASLFSLKGGGWAADNYGSVKPR